MMFRLEHCCSDTGDCGEQYCSDTVDRGELCCSLAECDAKEASTKSLAEMFILDKLSFRFLKQPGFKHFMSVSCPHFKIPSEATIREDCYWLFLQEKDKLKQHFNHSCPGRVSLTIDRWKTLQKAQYICVTAHYIDKQWKLNKRILSFCPISGTNGLEIGYAIESCLLDWGIKEVFSITVDGGSLNDVAINYLRDRFNQSGTGILGGKFLHVRCVSEIINLLAVDSLIELSMSVKRVREAIRCILQPHYRLSAFREWVANQGFQNIVLRTDEPTDWRSTYLMLESASKLERAFIEYAWIDEDYGSDLLQAVAENGSKIGMPDETDCANVKWLVKILKLLYDLAFNISGSSNLTSDAYFSAMCCVPIELNDWIKSDDLELRQRAVRMKEKCEELMRKMEGNYELVCIAMMLDTKYKLDFVEIVFSEMYEGDVAVEFGKQIRQAAHQLFHDYNTRFESLWWLGKMSQKASNRYAFDREMCLLKDREGKTELVNYLGSSFGQWDKEAGALEWWRNTSSSYPIISKMARDVLAVPITSVAPEAAFNTNGRVLDEFMSSLPPGEAEVLICTRDWMRSSPELVPVGDSLDKFKPDFDKLEEMENLW